MPKKTDAAKPNMKQIICDMWQKAYQIKGKTDAQTYVLYVTASITISCLMQLIMLFFGYIYVLTLSPFTIWPATMAANFLSQSFTFISQAVVIILVWPIVTGTIRRYHDLGLPTWVAICVEILCLPGITMGLAFNSFTSFDLTFIVGSVPLITNLLICSLSSNFFSVIGPDEIFINVEAEPINDPNVEMYGAHAKMKNIHHLSQAQLFNYLDKLKSL